MHPRSAGRPLHLSSSSPPAAQDTVQQRWTACYHVPPGDLYVPSIRTCRLTWLCGRSEQPALVVLHAQHGHVGKPRRPATSSQSKRRYRKGQRGSIGVLRLIAPERRPPAPTSRWRQGSQAAQTRSITPDLDRIAPAREPANCCAVGARCGLSICDHFLWPPLVTLLGQVPVSVGEAGARCVSRRTVAMPIRTAKRHRPRRSLGHAAQHPTPLGNHAQDTSATGLTTRPGNAGSGLSRTHGGGRWTRDTELTAWSRFSGTTHRIGPVTCTRSYLRPGTRLCCRSTGELRRWTCTRTTHIPPYTVGGRCVRLVAGRQRCGWMSCLRPVVIGGSLDRRVLGGDVQHEFVDVVVVGAGDRRAARDREWVVGPLTARRGSRRRSFAETAPTLRPRSYAPPRRRTT